jgi:hypothetical protein
LVDAYIVIGHLNEPEPLRMPAPAAFHETDVSETARPVAEPPRAIADDSQAAPSRRVVRVTPAPPETAPLPRIELTDPTAPLRPRRRDAERAADTAFALPPHATYDDGDGPPIEGSP